MLCMCSVPNAGTATRSLATLLPSASCSPKHTVSASARIEPAEPFRICRYMPPISMNYFIAGNTSHQTSGSFESRIYLFADH